MGDSWAYWPCARRAAVIGSTEVRVRGCVSCSAPCSAPAVPPLLSAASPFLGPLPIHTLRLHGNPWPPTASSFIKPKCRHFEHCPRPFLVALSPLTIQALKLCQLGAHGAQREDCGIPGWIKNKVTGAALGKCLLNLLPSCFFRVGLPRLVWRSWSVAVLGSPAVVGVFRGPGVTCAGPSLVFPPACHVC